MLAAITSYQYGHMGLNAAAKLYNIPRATLRRKVEGLLVAPNTQGGSALQGMLDYFHSKAVCHLPVSF